jgi:adenylosuccinate synthase
MKKAQIVIGLGFGDEGKGITTDFLASQNPEAVVIRFSGGQQAAHTE